MRNSTAIRVGNVKIPRLTLPKKIHHDVVYIQIKFLSKHPDNHIFKNSKMRLLRALTFSLMLNEFEHAEDVRHINAFEMRISK